MNRETAKKLLPVINALAEGKDIEWRNPDGVWEVIINPKFGHDPERYRIKPEPKEIWVNEYSDGDVTVYACEAEARMNASSCATRKAVRYREVLED